MESQFEYIKRKTSKKQSFCKCELCKSQCRVGCMATPEDTIKLINSGYGNRLEFNVNSKYGFIKPIVNKETNMCTFFKNGLCELHESGLKPTEGKLSHHSTTIENFNPKKSISFHIKKLWENMSYEGFEEMIDKIQNAKNK